MCLTTVGTDLVRYEMGELDQDDTAELFQRLLDTGYINHLQGSYQRELQRLIVSGEVNYEGIYG